MLVQDLGIGSWLLCLQHTPEGGGLLLDSLRELVQHYCTTTLEPEMAVKTTYSHARENLATLWDEVEDSREAAVIQRRGHEDMALIPADELSGLRRPPYLLRSPENAVRLLAALTRARKAGPRASILPHCAGNWERIAEQPAVPISACRGPGRVSRGPAILGQHEPQDGHAGIRLDGSFAA